MPEIRALNDADLPAVEGLLDALLHGWGGDREFLAGTVLVHPWADPEITSLVAVDEAGEIFGFVGAQVRRLRFDDRELRGVCCSHLVVAPNRRGGAAGALLLGRLLKGPQDLTWSDSANEAVVRMWRTFGGHLDHSRACDWMLVLRPAAWIGAGIAAALRRRARGHELLPVGALPLHAIPGRGAGPRRPAELGPEVSGVDVGAAEIVEHLPSLTSRLRLRVDYDAAHLEHLFVRIRKSCGELVCRLVRRNDRPIGWYAYLPRRSAASRVLHLAAPERQVESVLGELVDDATRRGATVLAGRLEPNLDAALRARRAVIGFAREPVLHSHDPELRATLATGSSLLTQLDSEWFVT